MLDVRLPAPFGERLVNATKLGIALALVLLLELSTAAQERAREPLELGDPIECYRVQPGYIVSVLRDERGEVTELTVEVGTLVGGSIQSTDDISESERFRLIDVFAPPASRGARLPNFGMTICAGACSDVYGFAEVTVKYSWSPLAEGNGHPVLTFRWRDKAPYVILRRGKEPYTSARP